MGRDFRFYRTDPNNRTDLQKNYDRGEELNFSVGRRNDAIQSGHFTQADLARIIRRYATYLLQRCEDDADSDNNSDHQEQPEYLDSDDLAEAIQVYAALIKETSGDVWIEYD